MFDLVIRGDRVVTPHGVGAWDVAVKDGAIAALAAHGSFAPDQAARVIDAGSGIVMPGGIDPHVHCAWYIPPLRPGAPPGRSESDLTATGYRRVIATVKHVTDTVVDLTIGGDTTTATPDHPFWVVNRNDWVPAGDLRAGDLFVKADGSTIRVDLVGQPRHGQFTVYNLEVDDLHTYHAGKHAVLVHNGACARKIATTGYRVYALVKKNAAGAMETIYYGITRQEFTRRAYQHMRDGKVFDNIVQVFPGLGTMTRQQAKALERMLIEMGWKFPSPVINLIR